MRPKTIVSLGAALFLSFVSLPSSQEAAPDKATLRATEQARAKLQNQVHAEKARMINQINQLPQDQRPRALSNAVKNSLILQQARGSEEEENQAQDLRKVNSETEVSMSEIIAHINSLPVAERKYALREAMKALKGKKLENAQN